VEAEVGEWKCWENVGVLRAERERRAGQSREDREDSEGLAGRIQWCARSGNISAHSRFVTIPSNVPVLLAHQSPCDRDRPAQRDTWSRGREGWVVKGGMGGRVEDEWGNEGGDFEKRSLNLQERKAPPPRPATPAPRPPGEAWAPASVGHRHAKADAAQDPTADGAAAFVASGVETPLARESPLTCRVIAEAPT
jgi:hypothetical protein